MPGYEGTGESSESLQITGPSEDTGGRAAERLGGMAGEAEDRSPRGGMAGEGEGGGGTSQGPGRTALEGGASILER